MAIRSPFASTNAELIARLNDLEQQNTVLMQRMIDLEGLVRDLQSGGDVGAYLAARVDAAASDPHGYARTIYTALANEMHLPQGADRTLVTHAQRIAATYDADGKIFADDVPSRSVKLARYLAEPVAGPNAHGSAVTRRLHTALDCLGIVTHAAQPRE